jgi:HEAT repeat protein
MIEQLLAGNSSVKVKENALFVLSQSRTARAREIVANVAKDAANPELQRMAVRYLGAMGGPENRQVLEGVYRSAADASIKRALIGSFMTSGDREQLLSIARSESSPELRGEAIQMLGAMRATTELSELYGSESSVDIRKRIMQALFVTGNADKLLELAKSEKDEQLRRSAVRNLGVMSGSKTGEGLRALYAPESSPQVKREIINALFIQRNATALVDLARAEKDGAIKREIVSRLSVMRSKDATDYLIELLK